MPEGKSGAPALRYWTQAAIIGAVYVVLTFISYPLSYGLFQVRVSEMLAVLPYFTPAAIPGLFAGCFIANLFGGNGILDIVFGPLATLAAAVAVSKIKWKPMVPVPPIVINAVVVGLVLHYVLVVPLPWTVAMVGLGQAVACYGLGFPLLLFLERRQEIFSRK